MAKGKKTGGRQAGTLNKATADVKEAARAHGPQAIAILARLMVEADSDAAKIAACDKILDRAYGKPTQLHGGDEGAAAIRTVHEIILRGVRPDFNDRNT